MSWRTAARGVETRLCRAALGAGAEGRGLVTLFFHALAPDGTDFGAAPFDPYQRITVSTLKSIVDLLRDARYTFVTPGMIEDGLVSGKRYAWLTFDDGYANNLVLADLSKRWDCPFTVFVSTGHVETGEAFWFDALWRHHRARGVDPAEHERRREALKALPPEAIAARLLTEFGKDALAPEGDLDRPMRVGELTAFAKSGGIAIGNHTRHHAILTVLSTAEAAGEIARAQTDLEGWLGIRPRAIAYPNGDHDGAILEAARGAGLYLGVTTRFGRAAVPLRAPMALPRHALSAHHPRTIADQLVRVRLPVSPSALAQAMVERIGGRRRRTGALHEVNASQINHGEDP